MSNWKKKIGAGAHRIIQLALALAEVLALDLCRVYLLIRHVDSDCSLLPLSLGCDVEVHLARMRSLSLLILAAAQPAALVLSAPCAAWTASNSSSPR